MLKLHIYLNQPYLRPSTSTTHTIGKEEDKYNRVPILTRENHESWFLQVKFKLKAKGAYYTVEITKVQYAWIPRDLTGKAATPTPTETETTTSSISSNAEVENLTTSFERLGGTWHVERSKEYDHDESKVFAFLVDCLSRDDQVLLEAEDVTASSVWTHLKAKYSKTSESTVQNYMTKIQTFEFDENKGIDAAWDKLKEYVRKMESGDPSLKGIYLDKTLLYILTQKLPKLYTLILDRFCTN